jgi:hypothetical protein
MLSCHPARMHARDTQRREISSAISRSYVPDAKPETDAHIYESSFPIEQAETKQNKTNKQKW